MKNLLPEYEIINLGLDGSCASSILEDLAVDETFNGIILCDIMSQCIMFGDYEELNVQDFSRYYHRMFSLDRKLNRIIASWVQENLVLIDPYLSFVRISGSIAFRHEFPRPKYWRILKDRTEMVDYKLRESEDLRIRNLKRARQHYEKLEEFMSDERFSKKLNLIKKSVDKINNRGGRVVFLRFPVSGSHWELDEMFFPRNRYWDRFAKTVNAKTIHFKDFPELETFEFPDTSHLDFRDTPGFTKILVSVLKQEGVF